MVGFYRMPEEDTKETKEARGKQHYVMFEADECGEQLRACQPELNWLRLPNAVLPFSELLLFVYSGAVASAEATDIEWAQAAPTIKNVTEVWGAITMHMHDWTRCNMGTLCMRIKKAVHLMDARPVLYPEPKDKDRRTYEVTMDYEDKVHTAEVKKLTKAVDEAATKPAEQKALRAFNLYFEKDGIPYDYQDWFEYVHPAREASRTRPRTRHPTSESGSTTSPTASGVTASPPAPSSNAQSSW